MKTIWLKKHCKIIETRSPVWDGNRLLKTEFFVHGKLHNEAGPALIYPRGGSSYYYLNGELELWLGWKASIYLNKLVKSMFAFKQSHYFLFAILCELNMFICINKLFWKDTILFGLGTIAMLTMAVLTSKRIPKR